MVDPNDPNPYLKKELGEAKLAIRNIIVDDYHFEHLDKASKALLLPKQDDFADRNKHKYRLCDRLSTIKNLNFAKKILAELQELLRQNGVSVGYHIRQTISINHRIDNVLTEIEFNE